MNNWTSTMLGDICEIYQPQTISKKELIQNGAYPVYGANGVIGRYDQYNHEESELLVTCRGATCGSVNISEPKSWITGNAMVVRPISDELDRRYLEYLFRGGIDLAGVITGAAQPQITRKSLAPVVVSYPPLPEQRRIVAILDEAFEGIDKAIANTEQNLANAQELFEKYLDKTFGGENDNWDTNKLEKIGGEVATGPFGSLLHKSDYIENGIPLVNPANISDGVIEPDLKKTVSKKTRERLSSHVLKPGQIVVGRRGEIGRCAVVASDQDGWLCGTGCFVIKPCRTVDPDFLAFLIRSRVYRSELERLATGATMKNLSNTSLRNLSISVPSVDDQKQILAKFDVIHTESERLRSLYQRKLDALDELKQSILQRAFSGELTAREAAA